MKERIRREGREEGKGGGVRENKREDQERGEGGGGEGGRSEGERKRGSGERGKEGRRGRREDEIGREEGRRM